MVISLHLKSLNFSFQAVLQIAINKLGFIKHPYSGAIKLGFNSVRCVPGKNGGGGCYGF